MIDDTILERAQEWLDGNYDEETKGQIRNLIDTNPTELTDSFYKDLDFGTGGLRGIMGPGTNRVNMYTIGMATQGLANYLLQSFPNQEIKLAIAHDSRNNSSLFARKAAEVLSANGIKVYLFDALRPTPELSFAIRHLGCQSGIVITASHNPKEYNGYKVYWEDGGQLVAPHDKNVITEVRKIKSPDDVNFKAIEDNIRIIGDEVDKVYLDEVKKLSLSDEGKEDIKIIFTSIHGTAIMLVPDALRESGFENIYIVKEQAEPNGNFPTVKSPNPEEAAALDMAVKLADDVNADMVIGTDPDADRVGIAVRNPKGEMVLLNGNQAGSLLVYYLIKKWEEAGKLDGKQFVAETIVTTGLIEDIAKAHNIDCPIVLTGFKYIAELIREREGKQTFIGGGEESYGYLIGDFVRDKDAVSSAVMLAEIAAWAKAQNSSFFDKLLDLYVEFGFYKEHLISITKKGKAGAEEIQAMMDTYRNNPPKQINGQDVTCLKDYQNSESIDLTTGEKTAIDLPKSNVLQFFTADGSKITARPSGTEPKIKFYFSVKGTLDNKADYEKADAELKAKIDSIISDLGL